jgi:hypothetical protein
VYAYAPLMPERREIVKFAGAKQFLVLTPGGISLVKFRRFLEPFPLQTIVAEDDQLYLFTRY